MQPTRPPLVFDPNRAPGSGEVASVHSDGSITYRGVHYPSLATVPESCRYFRADLAAFTEWRRLYRAVCPPGKPRR
jgi:hypothetical protein